MNKLLKPIVAMFLAFALLLTSGGALSTVNAAEYSYYVKFEYVDESNNVIKESDPIKENETFELQQGQKGYFYLYENDKKIEKGDYVWYGPVKNLGKGKGYTTCDYVQTSEVSFVGIAMFDFNLKVCVNTTALDETIENADKIEQGSSSDEAWESFQKVLSEAKGWEAKISEDQGKSSESVTYKVTQQDIDTATAALNTAIVNLKKEDLQTAINDAEELKAEDYKEEGWKALQTAVDEAKALQAKEDVTVKEIEDAIDKVYTAYNELEPKINEKWEELKASVRKAEAIKNDNYTEESWKALQTAIKNAKDLINTEDDVKIETVENAIKAIEEAVKGLKTKPAEVPTTPTAPATEKTTAKKEETVKYTVAKTTLKKAKKSGKKVQLTWKKVKTATGYEVYQATKKNGKYKKVKTIKKNKVVTCKTKSLKKKTYFFKVRTYRKVAGKTYYGAFSNVKKVVVK